MIQIILLLLLFNLPLKEKAYDWWCSNSVDELGCVLELYPMIYYENPEYFWKVLTQAQLKASSCVSPKITADFLLAISRLEESGADLEEFISEGLEELCVTQPNCFRQAISTLDAVTRINIKRKLEHPIYYEADELSACYR